MRILIVEDERRISGFLVRGLTEEGHKVELVEDLAAARAAAAHGEFDLGKLLNPAPAPANSPVVS